VNAIAEAVKYPIYVVGLRWMEDGDGDRMKWWPSDPGAGRIWNSVSTSRMYRDDPTPSGVERWALDEWWPGYATEKLADKNPSDPTVTVQRGVDEEWCCGWFSHWTFDTGQSDLEALASFAAYVHRIEDYNREHGEYVNGYFREAVCLMGAGDRWRWTARATGTSIVGSGETTGAPPCRCEHCKAAGILRIDH
jgi:hypothetical protein